MEFQNSPTESSPNKYSLRSHFIAKADLLRSTNEFFALRRLPESKQGHDFAGANWTIWALIASTGLVIVAAYLATGLRVVPGRFGVELSIFILALSVIAIVYRTLRPDPWISRGCETAAQMTLIALLSTLLGFAAAAGGARFPLRDHWLAMADQALGLNWKAYIALADATPSVQSFMRACYGSINITYVMVLFCLLDPRHTARLNRFLVALWVSLMLTMAIFFFVPASAAYVYYRIDLNDLQTLRPTYLLNEFQALLVEMRTPGPHIVHFDHLEGLVTFPSFHAEAAILFTWAIWANRWLRWPMLVINSVLVAAAPIEGAHYFVDILGGAFVAALAIAVACALPGLAPSVTRERARFATLETSKHPLNVSSI